MNPPLFFRSMIEAGSDNTINIAHASYVRVSGCDRPTTKIYVMFTVRAGA